MTAVILLSLLAGPATTEELAEEVERVTGVPIKAKDVQAYLSYYRRKGWVTCGSPLWSLTEEGRELVKKYERWLTRLVGEHERGGKRVVPGLVSDTKPDETISYRILKTQVDAIIERVRELLKSRDEEDVLRVLLEHYARTGSTYMYLDELAARLETTPSWLYQEVLRHMRSRRLVYVWRDGKVGLGRNMRRVLGLEW